jgi:hypothetical protein
LATFLGIFMNLLKDLGDLACAIIGAISLVVGVLLLWALFG